MSDIHRRLQRHRLSRYGGSSGAFRWPWVWAALGLWLVWASFLSDHSFYHLWRIERESARERADLQRLSASLQQTQRQTRDRQAQLEAAEQVLREQDGMARPNEIIYRVEDPDDSTPAR